MAAGTSGSALDDILSDRVALEAHFGIHLDSDESDLDVPSDDEWTDYGIKALKTMNTTNFYYIKFNFFYKGGESENAVSDEENAEDCDGKSHFRHLQLHTDLHSFTAEGTGITLTPSPPDSPAWGTTSSPSPPVSPATGRVSPGEYM